MLPSRVHTELGLHDWSCTSSAVAGHHANTSVFWHAKAATSAKHMVLSACPARPVMMKESHGGDG